MQRIVKHDKYVVVSSVDVGEYMDLSLFKMLRKAETRIDPKKSNIKQPTFYTPFATKSPFLLAILCALLACIALLEIALENGTKIESNSDGITHQTARYKRQAASSASSSDATSSYTSIIIISGTMTPASGLYNTVETTPAAVTDTSKTGRVKRAYPAGRASFTSYPGPGPRIRH